MEEADMKKRRRKGTGSFFVEQRRLKVAGKEHRTYKNQVKPEKKRPNAVVST